MALNSLTNGVLAAVEAILKLAELPDTCKSPPPGRAKADCVPMPAFIQIKRGVLSGATEVPSFSPAPMALVEVKIIPSTSQVSPAATVRTRPEMSDNVDVLFDFKLLRIRISASSHGARNETLLDRTLILFDFTSPAESALEITDQTESTRLESVAAALAAAADTADTSVDVTDPTPAVMVDATHCAAAEFQVKTCASPGVPVETLAILSSTKADKRCDTALTPEMALAAATDTIETALEIALFADVICAELVTTCAETIDTALDTTEIRFRIDA